ncbi:MAG TPA: thiamine pyrophosphate-dependent enzyme [Acidobacteriaceae bacterium]|nr:thiamine pyrophosphate-dependent enzyme [Acidobacteriaceae bacterium]
MATKVRELAETTPNSSHPNPLISHGKLRQLYSTMLQCRMLHECARTLGQQGGLQHDDDSSADLEATVVGTAIHLRPEDILASLRGNMILKFLKGAPLPTLFHQLYGRSTPAQDRRFTPDNCGYLPLNVTRSASTLAAGLDMCTNIASANLRNKIDNIVMAFPGEGPRSRYEWHNALRSAGERGLPIVFVRQSSLPAESAYAKRERTKDDNGSVAVDYAFPTIPVDRTDAVAVYRVAQEAVERARLGGGPTLIEAQTLGGYQQTETGSRKRQPAEVVEERQSTDPIVAMERYLAGKHIFSEDWKKEITAAFQQDLSAAVKIARK